MQEFPKQRVRYAPGITHGDIPAHGVVLVEIFQLHAQHGGLDLVEAAVAPFHVEHVLAARTVIADGSHHVGQRAVVGRHGSGVAERAEVLARIEAMARGVAERACTPKISSSGGV